jgi:hypothetical protein
MSHMHVNITPSSNQGVKDMPDCSIEECRKPAIAKTYCYMHYRRLRVHGSPYETKALVREKCSVYGCEKLRIGHGYCSKHYQRFMKHGDPNFQLGTGKGEAIRYLAEIVIPYVGEDCLTWPFAKTKYGYGTIGRGEKAKSNLVHRLVCESVYGSPPSHEHEAAHSCGKGHEGCVNPRHLRWDTRHGNQADRVVHGTAPRGEKSGKAKITESQAREIKSLLRSVKKSDIAEYYGISYGAVYAIETGKSWAWLT